MTAGRKFAAAVPDVHTRATGARFVLARPRAKKAAERSSMWVQQRSSGCRAVATASGVERDPGHRQTSRTPARASSSKNAVAKA